MQLGLSDSDGVWTLAAPMPNGRAASFGIEHSDGKLLVFGGEAAANQATNLDVIDEYDIEGDTWSTIPATLETKSPTETVKINSQTVWVYLMTPKEIREFNLDSQTFQTSTIPPPPFGRSQFELSTVLPFLW